MFKIIGKIVANNFKLSLLDMFIDLLIKTLQEYRRTRNLGDMDIFSRENEDEIPPDFKTPFNSK